ncbi:MAG TPA: methyltransferase domain-containing protein [Candidatus Polarisedimenticolaceae bacterium]|nr:methyltransferase domain-containing protein [Candidatus Polarisedimenticolaceae bacterium]
MSGSKEYFDAIGAGWDRMQQSFFSERIRERAFAIAGVQAGRLAADLGAGTGFVTGGLLERGLRVIAVDQSPAMLATLRAKFPDADCRGGDAAALPIDDDRVAYCFANMFLHHVDDPPRAIGEMARVTAPGGRIVVTDLDLHQHEFLRVEHHDRWMGFARADVERWFRAAGLTEVHIACLDERCCACSEAGEQAAIGIFAASGTKPARAVPPIAGVNRVGDPC